MANKFAGKGGTVYIGGSEVEASSWSIEYNADTAEVTRMQAADSGDIWKEFLSGQTMWTASVEAFSTDAGGLLSNLGSTVVIDLNLTGSVDIGGNGIITGASTSQDNNGAVTITYQIQGTGALS